MGHFIRRSHHFLFHVEFLVVPPIVGLPIVKYEHGEHRHHFALNLGSKMRTFLLYLINREKLKKYTAAVYHYHGASVINFVLYRLLAGPNEIRLSITKRTRLMNVYGGNIKYWKIVHLTLYYTHKSSYLVRFCY